MQPVSRSKPRNEEVLRGLGDELNGDRLITFWCMIEGSLKKHYFDWTEHPSLSLFVLCSVRKCPILILDFSVRERRGFVRLWESFILIISSKSSLCCLCCVRSQFLEEKISKPVNKRLLQYKTYLPGEKESRIMTIVILWLSTIPRIIILWWKWKILGCLAFFPLSFIFSWWLRQVSWIYPQT